MLTHNNLQCLLFLFFLPIFLKNWQRSFPRLFSVLLAEVFLLIFVQNVCDQLKHKQTLKHARKMHAAI